MRHALALVLFVVACGTSSDHEGDDSPQQDASTSSQHDAAAPDATVATGDYLTIPLLSPDASFWGPTIKIGGQPFFMDLDTGSTTIGVAGATCTKCTGVSPLYAPTTGTDMHLTASTQYADNSGWSGEIYSDTVNVGAGAADVSLNLVDITAQTDFFDANVYQGILGMGDTSNAEPNTDAYMNKAVAANAFKNVMSFELCGMNAGTGTGTMWLGGYDATKASAAPAYTPLLAISNNQPFYAIDLTGMSIGTTSVGTGASAFEEPVVDTGTTFFYLPSSIFKASTNAIKASAGYTALFGTATLKENKCLTAANVTAAMVDSMLPPMTLTMPGINGGADVTITANAMESYFYDAGNGMFCYALGDGGTQDATTMGDAIMRNFVTVIDIANKQVGWAPDSGCGVQAQLHRVHTGQIAHPRPPKRKHHA